MDIASLKFKKSLPRGSRLLTLHPFFDSDNVVRVGGCESHTKLSYSQTHPVILDSKCCVAKLIICSEQVQILHAGPTSPLSSLSQCFQMICMRNAIRSITTRQCVIFRRQTIKLSPQIMGQLPLERVTPGAVFKKVDVDYGGPLYMKSGTIRRSVARKAMFVCLFLSLSKPFILNLCQILQLKHS